MKRTSLRLLLVVIMAILVITILPLAACSSIQTATPTQTTKPAVSTSSVAPTQAPANSLTLKWTSLEPDAKSSTHDLLVSFASQVDKGTQGRIKITVFYGGILGKPQDFTKLLRSGVADGAVLITTYHQWELPLFAAAGLPFLSTGTKMAPKAIWELMNEWPAMQEEWTKAEIKPIWAFQPSAHWLGLTMPITTLADLKGKKIWAGGFWPDLVQAFDITPVPLTAAEAYDGLQKGAIVGVINPYHTFRSYRYYEVLKAMVNWPFGGQPVPVFAISQNAWNKILAADQKVIMDISLGLTAEHQALMDAEQTDLDKFFKDQGLKFINLSDSEYANIAKVGKDIVWKTWLDTAKSKGVPGQEFLDRYQAKIKQVSQTVK